MAEATDRDRLLAVTIDAGSLAAGTPEGEQERRTAIDDLLAQNRFGLAGQDCGPYALSIALQDRKLMLDIRTAAGEPIVVHHLSLQPLRSVLKDYLMLCDAYVAALRTASPERIQSIDMGRRGLHNDGAERLTERLAGKVVSDFATMRRLFTLVTALHWKG